MALSIFFSLKGRLFLPSIVQCSTIRSSTIREFRTLPLHRRCLFVFCYKSVPSLVFKRGTSRTVVHNASSKGKAKIDKANFNRLCMLAKPEKAKIAGAICLLLVSSSITMAVPFALGKIIDVINNDNPEEMKKNLYTMSQILLAVFLVGGLCNFGRVYLMSISGQRITQTLRQKLFSSILKQEAAFFDKTRTGELVNRLSTDAYLVSHTLTSNISDGLRSTISIIAGVSMMMYISPSLALVGLITVPPVAGFAVYYGRFVRKITKQVQDALADATSLAQEKISNIKTVKTFSNEGRESAAYDKKLANILQLVYKEALAKGVFFGFAGLTGNMIILSVLYNGGISVSTGDLTVGNLSSFLMYAAYIGVSISGLTSFYSEMNKGLGASSRLWEIIDRTPSICDIGTLLPIGEPKGLINFDSVTFAYPSRKDVIVLKDLNLKIPDSSITAIVGSSGSGKSTLASLLLRLYDPDKGAVFLDGVRIDRLSPAWIRKYIGYVSQEPVLFSCSIRDNILYGTNDADFVTEDQLREIAIEANCLDFIVNFPKGFDTKVGERGAMLSGGQKQRIAIARALIKNPKILLLDEATSALDSESEHLVQESLEKIMKGRTVLTIAHRLSTIKNANQIAVMEKGTVIEIGTYNELMTLENGSFRRLIKHQAFL